MKIKVTQEHIDNGVPGECYKCPLALALQDAGFPNASLGSNFFHGVKSYRFEQSTEIKNWRLAFDFGKPVAPFEFELSV